VLRCLRGYVLANVRFFFNGWHSAARYQRRKGSCCVFCQRQDSEDSIEHLVVCPRIHDFFPLSLKRGVPPTVPVETFFLFGLSDKERVAVSIFMFALYTMHNELRHNPCHTDLNRTIFRIMAEVYMPAKAMRAWEEVFGLRPPVVEGRVARPQRQVFPSSTRPERPTSSAQRYETPDDMLVLDLCAQTSMHVPDTRSDTNNPFLNTQIHVPDTSSDVYVPDTALDALSDL